MSDNTQTESGLRLEGQYENKRNSDSSDLFKDIIREAFGVKDALIGHHLMYEARDQHKDGFTYEYVEEFPSADALIFDHGVAKKLWPDNWRDMFVKLALEPVETRDGLLKQLYYNRPQAMKKAA